MRCNRFKNVKIQWVRNWYSKVIVFQHTPYIERRKNQRQELDGSRKGWKTSPSFLPNHAPFSQLNAVYNTSHFPSWRAINQLIHAPLFPLYWYWGSHFQQDFPQLSSDGCCVSEWLVNLACNDWWRYHWLRSSGFSLNMNVFSRVLGILNSRVIF